MSPQYRSGFRGGRMWDMVLVRFSFYTSFGHRMDVDCPVGVSGTSPPVGGRRGRCVTTGRCHFYIYVLFCEGVFKGQ